MDEDDLFAELEKEQLKIEMTETNYIDDWVNEGYIFSINRIISNRTGGKRSGAD